MTCRVVYSILKGSDGGRWRWVVNFNPRPLYPWERVSVPTEYEAGWAPNPISTFLERNMSFLYLDSKPGPLTLQYSPFTRAGEPMTRGNISLVRDIHLCHNFFILFFYPTIVTNMCANTVGSRFATLRFTTIHFYDPCRVGPSTTDLLCITVATQASFLYLVRF